MSDDVEIKVGVDPSSGKAGVAQLGGAFQSEFSKIRGVVESVLGPALSVIKPLQNAGAELKAVGAGAIQAQGGIFSLNNAANALVGGLTALLGIILAVVVA